MGSCYPVVCRLKNTLFHSTGLLTHFIMRRLRLYLRHVTTSSPRMRVSAPILPRYLQWLLIVLFFVLSIATAIGAYHFGKFSASLPSTNLHTELVSLRQEVASLRTEKELTDRILTTSDTLLATELATRDKLSERIHTLEQENQTLLEDLRFFEKLIPTKNGKGLDIRGIQTEIIAPRQLRWRILLIQASKNPGTFKGQLSLIFNGEQNGKPWAQTVDDASLTLKFGQYERISGIYTFPENVTLKSLTVKVTKNNKLRAISTMKF